MHAKVLEKPLSKFVVGKRICRGELSLQTENIDVGQKQMDENLWYLGAIIMEILMGNNDKVFSKSRVFIK